MYNDIKSILNEKKYFKCQYDVLKKEFGRALTLNESTSKCEVMFLEFFLPRDQE